MPAQLEVALRERLSFTNLWCYNLGSGYHFSSQERARWGALLAENIVPHAVVFIDGLNEFYHPEGLPQFTSDFRQFSVPDEHVPNRLLFQNHKEFTDRQREPLIKLAIGRYHRNIHLSEALADRVGVKSLFVSQPIPFHSFPLTNAAVYPFHQPARAAEDRLCQLAYPQLREYAETGVLGTNHLWAGELFSNATQPMYADKVHYSPEGAKILARFIAEQMIARNLIPLPGK